MDERTIERRIVEQCAPTLARLKCGSIFRIRCDSEGFASEIGNIARVLGSKGIGLVILRPSGCGIAYVYREDMLRERISDGQTASFLEGLGYDCGSTDSAIGCLKKRVERTACIPHEIGIFIGYPLEDVVGFIENSGKGYKGMGCWKVYGDLDGAHGLFSRIRECRRSLIDRFDAGVPLARLAT